MTAVETNAHEPVVALSNEAGYEVDVVPWGASLKSFRVPASNADRLPVDMVLGYEDAEQYRRDSYYLGATVGRYAGRIRDGRFRLDGTGYRLPVRADQHGHCLHGGEGGFRDRYWSVEPEISPSQATLSLRSEAGENGFPGAVDARVTYTLNGSQLRIRLEAASDAPTVVNLTNHAYFNLAGCGTVDDHAVTICADRYTELDETAIPTGRILPVAGTPFDLRESRRLDQCEPYRDSGFDQNYVLVRDGARRLSIEGVDTTLAATVFSAARRRRLNVYTTLPGLQFYTGQHLALPFGPKEGLCLEAQYFPDSPNHPEFPSTVIRPGEPFDHLIVYEIEVDAVGPDGSQA